MRRQQNRNGVRYAQLFLVGREHDSLDAAIATGIAADKMLALSGQLPLVQIANIVLPTPEQDAQREAIDAKLDEITRRLAAP